MINNRQGGRRRGRGGQRGQNLGGQPGNRQDNRQRGNAAQLLEKYKSMARDAQLGGDRVQTEYYLQFADHYFRVLSENQARYNDQRPQRDRDFDDDGDEEMPEGADDQQSDGDGRDDDDRPARREARDRDDRGNRNDRGNREDRNERPDRGDRSNARRRFNREDGDGDERRPRANAADQAEPVGIPLDVLPPAIGREADGESEEPAQEARPRRRTRRPRAEDNDGEIAPAA